MDQEFESLVRNLKRIDPNNSYLYQNKVLPSMGNVNYGEFLETLLPDERLIFKSKIKAIFGALTTKEYYRQNFVSISRNII